MSIGTPEERTFAQEAAETDTQPEFVVGIGASAGGLDALERFFDNIPPDTGLAFVVVQHLSPDFKSLMVELLARHTNMPIYRVEDGMRVEANGVYLIPPKKNMAMSGGTLSLTEQDPSGGLNLPIDFFFRSLGRDCGPRAIAVVLSGTGSDGSRGVRDVHDAGGAVFVQDLKSAEFDGMPKNAVATGIATAVASASEIPDRILSFVRHPQTAVLFDEADEDLHDDGAAARVFRLFRQKYGIDFGHYKPATIERRLERRVQLTRCENIETYIELLESDTNELDSLYRDLLVEVTQFFRDTQAFEQIRRNVIPEIIDQAKPGDSIRVWVPGCATGEEAYTLAMLFHECSESRDRNLDIKIFATDVHSTSLETASAGVYSVTTVQKIPPELAERYFVTRGDLCHVTQPIRQMVIFAPHDLTKDPPFTKIDLISCRNVLIYFKPDVQKRVLSLFHFGLKVNATMMLGPSESVGDLAREFDPIDHHWRIYKKVRDIRLPDAVSIPTSSAIERVIRTPTPMVASGIKHGEGVLVGNALENLLERYVPPSLLVNEFNELVHSFGDARRLLVQPPGRPTLEILKMVEGDLRLALSAGLHRAARESRTVVFEGVKVEDQQFKVIVDPYPKGNKSLYLICFEPMQTTHHPEPLAEEFRTDDQSADRITELERELDYMRESLQSTVEELESSNEELQSTNEELVASNEELQSTNEELHSVNEELYTVNSEHQRKIDELTELTGDMDNLLRCSEIATVFLDSELRIRKFTPAIKSAFNVIDQDIGRPIEHIAFNLENPNLVDDLRRVLATGETLEKEVTSRDGRTYLNRILPYQTEEWKSEGVVLTLVDVTLLKQAERYQDVLEATPTAMLMVNPDGRVSFLNAQAERMFGYERSELIGEPIEALLPHRLADKYGQHRAAYVDNPVERHVRALSGLRKDGFEFPIEVTLSPIKTDRGVSVLAMVVNVRERDHSERQRGAVHAMVEQLSAAASFDDAVPQVLEELCTALDVEVAEFWLPSQDDDQLRLVAFHSTLQTDVTRELEDASWKSSYTLGQGLVGAVGEKCEPIWMASLGAEQPRGRARALASIGLRVGCGFPLVAGHECLGVVTFFSRHAVNRTRSLMTTLLSVGRCVGQFLRLEQYRDLYERLDVSDRDLQLFAYAVSHDLQTPLRHMTDYAERLRGSISDGGSEEVEHSLSVISDGVLQLQRMIKTLLDFSRVYTQGKPFLPTALDRVVDSAVDSMRHEIEAAGGSVTCGALPELQVDEVQIKSVFRHLIDNAIKYRSDDPPVIDISAAKDRNDWVISVRDNGIGILPEQTERVFVIFQRLGFKEKVPGNGVGLALSKRIIQRHGGSIWVEPQHSGGSTFSFRLPVKPDNRALPPPAEPVG